MRARERILMLLRSANDELSGGEIGRICHVGSWRLYPILADLERRHVVVSDWEFPESFGMPRRRMYRVYTATPRASRLKLADRIDCADFVALRRVKQDAVGNSEFEDDHLNDENHQMVVDALRAIQQEVDASK